MKNMLQRFTCFIPCLFRILFSSFPLGLYPGYQTLPRKKIESLVQCDQNLLLVAFPGGGYFTLGKTGMCASFG